MKLILLTIQVWIAVAVKSQKLQDENFSFPPQFQTPSSILYSSDSSIYLPPETQSAIPYLQLQAFNNLNKLPYQFLPATATKTPPMYPTPFPIMLSSTFKSDFGDEDDDNIQSEPQSINRRFMNLKPITPNNINHTFASQQNVEKPQSKSSSRISNYPYSSGDHEVKSPHLIKPSILSSNKVVQQNPINPATRRMIVTSEIKRADLGIDQINSASMINSKHVHAPNVFITSTAEPAIPILRLSNEMDLDGSFSYEALGADQTHYVQHSRMENMGTDKEEQVVEGSYSYVGDDGRTYTVHYVADSNGYRASGDHLPVPPPIPEIIQRAVQFNLAEEARKPPHLKSSWEKEETEFQVGEETRRNTFHIPPPRNLFTGKTPEAFSFGFSQGSKSPNSVSAASFPSPSTTNFEIIPDQSKIKGNTQTHISPQITFLASQGTHNPSTQPQSTAAKVVSIEKSSLPQLINYEADIKEPEQESHKALWRWQYGLNANSNQIPSKNSISRSSGEGDDIIINFTDMTPDQYKQMMQSQILGKNPVDSNTIERNIETQYSSPNYNQNMNPYSTRILNPDDYKTNTVSEQYQFFSSTETSNINSLELDKIKKDNSDVHSKLITSQNFIPESQIATKTYNVKDASYEPTQINAVNEDYAQNFSVKNKIEYPNINTNQYVSLLTKPQARNTSTESITNLDNGNTFDLNYGGKNMFQPIIYTTEKVFAKYETTTTEPPLEETIKENIFLKNIFKSHNSENADKNASTANNHQSNDIIIESKVPKFHTSPSFQQQASNDLKHSSSKSFDISDVLNYIAMKNHFESIKTKPKNKQFLRDNSLHYIPVKDNIEDNESNRQESDNQMVNNQQEREMQGLIKNYKVLQRHKNSGPKSQIISEPQRHIKAFHTQGLPPLGRAGPSMKSYLPPTYV